MTSDTIKRLRGELLLTHGRDRAEFRWLDVSRLVDIAEVAQRVLDEWGDPQSMMSHRTYEELAKALERFAGPPSKK